MFANELYENWDSTEGQDAFIKSYFGNGKVLTKKFQKSKKQSNDYKSENIHSHQDELCNIKQNRNNKRFLIDHQSKSSKKFKKSGSQDKEVEQDNFDFCKEGKFEAKKINNTNISESVNLRPKKKKKNRNKSKIEGKTEASNVDNDSNDKDVTNSNCLSYYNSNGRTERVEEFLGNSSKDITLENEKMVEYSNSLESNQPQSKKKKRRKKNKNKHNGVPSEGKVDIEDDVSKAKSSISSERQGIFMASSSQDYFKSKEMAKCPSNLENCKLKSKKKINNKNKHDLEYTEDIEEETEDDLDETGSNTNIVPKDTSPQNKNLFQTKMHQKLTAAKFRYLNEMLYRSVGNDALSYFQENTDEFHDYHEGYKSQVSKWPLNPVDVIIKEIKQTNKEAVIADFGCGEAKIAEAFPKRTVHSFDLVAFKDCVTACDMANVPLPNNSVDIAVFCLSLMGTNWKDYVKEGYRILKHGGMLKVAEIESRIESMDKFIKNIEKYGLSLVNKNTSHKMFVFLNFKKVNKNKKSSSVPDIILKPCLYKKR